MPIQTGGETSLRQARPPEHPWREIVANEVHARPVELVPATGSAYRVGMLLPNRPDAVISAQDQFSAWCTRNGLEAPRGRQHSYQVARHKVTWELHTEFVTLTWMSTHTQDESWPEGIGLEALAGNALMMATRIDITKAEQVPESRIAELRLTSLSVSNIEGGRGQIATDLVPDKDGFTRIEFAAGNTSEVRRAVVVRRLLEIETYRVFALLGLPLARELSPQLSSAEADLSTEFEVMGRVATVEASHTSLDKLQSLSLAASQLAEKTGYRFAASFAYADVLNLRLERLGEESVGYASTLRRYLITRIDPAIATCRAFEKRQAALASKLDRAIGLLNTRIGLDMQMQNRLALRSISDTAKSQYRLQRTVEGLSAIAISYYALAILSYILTGAGEVTKFSEPLAVALSAPLVIVLAWIALRWVQRQDRS
jgi:uncharacterized membrane-anchored protein